MRFLTLCLSGAFLIGCSTSGVFKPRSEYPPDPYVKGYANPEDCIGGESLAAIDLTLPDYPSRAYRTGRQGWVLLRLDIATDGSVSSAEAERALPEGLFANSAVKAAEAWRFEPPASGALSDCRVLIRYRLGEVSLGG